ncbi:hypothetical protein KIPB_015204, partial [Kipferlia bialata]|eukprot:g15204.t1
MLSLSLSHVSGVGDPLFPLGEFSLNDLIPRLQPSSQRI